MAPHLTTPVYAPDGSAVVVQDEGSETVAQATTIDFRGAGVVVTEVGGAARVTIAGPASGDAPDIAEEGVTVGDDPPTRIDFVGAGVTVTDAGGGTVTVTIPADVVGPASSVDNAIPRYDGTTGKLLQGTTNGPKIDDSGNVTMTALKTIDGRDPSVDGTALDGHIADPMPHAGHALASDLDLLTTRVGEAEDDIEVVATDLASHIADPAPHPNEVPTSRTITVGGLLQAAGGGATDLSADFLLTTSIATGKLAGRSTAGTGVLEAITVGSNLSLVGGTLSASTSGGDVVGPASSTDNAIARFDGTTGKLLQNGATQPTIDDSGNIGLTALKTVDGRDLSVDGAALDAHVAAASPHSAHATLSGGLVPIAQIPTGTVSSSSTVPLNNDARLGRFIIARCATIANDTLSGLAARDAITPVAGEIVLVRQQTTVAENGLYAAAAGAWSRVPETMVYGLTVSVAEGNVMIGSVHQLQGDGTSWSCLSSQTQNEICRPVYAAAASTSILSTTLQGGMYRTEKRILFGHAICRTSGVSGSGTYSVAIYQVPGGAMKGTARLIASATAIAAAAGGNQDTALTPSLAIIEPGYYYVLVGKYGGTSVTFVTWAGGLVSLLTTNMLSGTVPAIFSSSLSPTTLPATIDPATDLTVSGNDLHPIIRLRY